MSDKNSMAEERPLTIREKNAIDILIAGAKISGDEETINAIELIYGEAGVRYAQEQLELEE